ncbi:TonB-dependent receptor domain-containing protein [Manganibacter manganicus]|uniref:TonB-dependent receptor n=1 Tax=Manganibacter manganicus TaxID=1873176 RepID=A0A1V8RUU8_9HYPH|nr:TonB-dependent receptor [Pseudaminobacter manganicus]OQM76976.1 TonB-dependent receptor [Pseudaminobacter manganicus]
MKTIFIAAGTLSLALTGAGVAQDAGTDEQGVTKLDRILITTPLRRESSLERSTSSVTVVSEEDIKQSAAPDLPSLLKSYPGVSVTTNGGMGADSSVSLRGTTAAQTLVLVNGVRAGSATAGTVNLSSIPLSSIERIEIAKGGHSAQYGADAIGGIINIITRQGGICSDGRQSCATATVGVMHPWGGYVSGNVQGQSESGVNYSFGAQVIGTEGYDFTTSPYDLDKDGFLQGSANFALSKDFDAGRIYADGLFTRGRTDYDSAYKDSFTGAVKYPADTADNTTFVGKVGARIDHSDTWASTVEFMTAVDNSSNFRGEVKGDDFNTLRYGVLASTQKTFEYGEAKNTILGGVEAYRESIDGSTGEGMEYANTKRDLAAVFGQYSFEYKALTIDTGIRYDHDEQFGGATTYNIGASYELMDGLVARASYATGFRAPTFNDLYYPYSGNPDLRPEKSRSYEVGLNWSVTDQTTLDMALYRNDLDDMIAWAPVDPSNPSGFWQPSNVDKAGITGFEATLGHEFNDEWAGRLGIDIREPLNKSPGVHGKYVPYGDRFKATAGLTYKPTEKLELSAAVIYGMSRYADAANLEKLPDYVTADFTAHYALDEQSQFKFSVANIFDEQYQTKQGYRAPGRTFDLSFTRSF